MNGSVFFWTVPAMNWLSNLNGIKASPGCPTIKLVISAEIGVIMNGLSWLETLEFDICKTASDAGMITNCSHLDKLRELVVYL